MTDEEFNKITLENTKEVLTWPKWMQKIKISYETISTGQFNMSESEWRKWKKDAERRVKQAESKK